MMKKRLLLLCLLLLLSGCTQQSVEKMIAAGVDTFVEIGPGRTLNGFLRKIDRQVKGYNIRTWEEMQKVCEELAQA